MDWDKNVDPEYRRHYFRPPILASEDDSHTEKWVVYATGYIAAKELTVQPGRTVTIRDKAAYGAIMIQGHGTFGNYDAEAAIMLRYGGLSQDEYFVSEQAAKSGIAITNNSRSEPLVLLKHFGPNNPETPTSLS